MCAGAMVHARVERVVYGAAEPKAGVFDSHPTMEGAWLNHRLTWQGGVLANECALLMSEFFAARRAEQGRGS